MTLLRVVALSLVACNKQAALMLPRGIYGFPPKLA